MKSPKTISRENLMKPIPEQRDCIVLYCVRPPMSLIYKRCLQATEMLFFHTYRLPVAVVLCRSPSSFSIRIHSYRVIEITVNVFEFKSWVTGKNVFDVNFLFHNFFLFCYKTRRLAVRASQMKHVNDYFE